MRNQGHANVSNIDDSLIISKTENEWLINIKETVFLLDNLGLTIHPDKSVLTPTNLIQFLEFWIHSVEMKVSLTQENIEAIVKLSMDILWQKQ